MKIIHGDFGNLVRELPEFGDLGIYLVPALKSFLASPVLLLHVAAHDLVVLFSGQ